MTDWSLPNLLAKLHSGVEKDLADAREAIGHPGSKGSASENVWLTLLRKHLPARYQVDSAHVVDSKNNFSDQIDIAIYDRHYTPIIFEFEGQVVLPAESIYAVFEAKQSINSDQVRYAQNKVASVRRLHRTNLPVRHAGGIVNEPELPSPVLGGLVSFESDWKSPLGDPLLKALEDNDKLNRLDLGCVAAHGIFVCDRFGQTVATHHGKAVTRFLLELMARLRDMGTVPVIDVRAYASWLR